MTERVQKIVTESLRMVHDKKLQTGREQRVQMVVIERLRMGCDRKSVNGS